MAAMALTAANFTGPDGGNWGDGANWDTGTVPTASEEARLNTTEDRAINLNGDYTIKFVQDGFSAGALTLGGTGTLTIDINAAAVAQGLNNATGDAGGSVQIDGNLAINNTGGVGRTIFVNSNSAANKILFNPGSNLVLTTGVQTQGTVGTIEFNGNISGISPLFIGSQNVLFGEGHDSTGLSSVVFFNNSLLTVNGGTVMAPVGTKFQINGTGTELELNAANTVNGANISVGGPNTFLVDVNANQENMGFIVFNGTGQLTIDVDAAVTNVSFASSYLQNWVDGAVTINGFKEGTIRFGTDPNGLTREQLDAINGGIYSLTAEGYLTEESINYWAGFEIDAEGYASLSPWIEQFAYVAAPFIWMDESGLFYMDESVGVLGRGWAYAYELDLLDISVVEGTDYGYSFSLDGWVYLPSDTSLETEAWVYLM